MSAENQSHIDKLLAIVESQIEALKGEGEGKQAIVDDLNVKLGEVTGVLSTLQQANTELQEQCDALTTKLEGADETVESYSDLGTPEEIEEALDKSGNLIESLNTRLQNTLPAVNESLRLQNIEEELKKYQAFGSLGDLKALRRESAILADRVISQKVSGLAKKYGCINESVQKLADKGLTFTEIEETLKSIKPAKPRSKLSSSSFSGKGKTPQDLNESLQAPKDVPSLSSKLFGRGR